MNSFWTSVLLNLFLGIVSGITTSFIWLHYTNIFRKAKVIIVDKIVMHTTNDGQVKFLFKIINASRKPLLDVSMKLIKYQSIPDSEGVNASFLVEELELLNQHLDVIRGYSKKNQYKESNVVIGTKINLYDHFQNFKYLTLQVSFMDPYTGMKRIIARGFSSKQSIVKGSFVSGKTFKVRKLKPQKISKE